MNINQASPFHLFCFVYIGFANLSNQKLEEEDMNEIQRKIAIWMNVNFSNVVEFNLILHQSSEWYNHIKQEEKLNSLLEVVRSIRELEGLNLEDLKSFLSDIRDIAIANGRFNEDEKQLHDKIARELGINVMTSDKSFKKKLGY